MIGRTRLFAFIGRDNCCRSRILSVWHGQKANDDAERPFQVRGRVQEHSPLLVCDRKDRRYRRFLQGSFLERVKRNWWCFGLGVVWWNQNPTCLRQNNSIFSNHKIDGLVRKRKKTTYYTPNSLFTRLINLWEYCTIKIRLHYLLSCKYMENCYYNFIFISFFSISSYLMIVKSGQTYKVIMFLVFLFLKSSLVWPTLSRKDFGELTEHYQCHSILSDLVISLPK